MKNLNKRKRGISIIGILFFGFIIVLVLSYFKISIRSVVESPTAQDNISYVGGGTRNLWDEYFRKPVSYLWNDIFINIFWASFINNMERIRDGQATDYEINAPAVNRK
ncbi:hypothetical protein A3B84_00050 [Candidatus Nomurabacteria bacterium RIFCSPHIGHO2_02_FULL_35_13]|uniref:Uncharacterized protein n=1 Tax=Candidatus Nomurabacteria bacterium RIFCSPHIGHO2_02_FULL_35_13 TaxID=1801748 RepID=A0A1F6VPR5_9BACT|nr:MAG: hypothetical protein A3B84_00050 [Candidatus Nomurabacteria bacterium RIFCSPHIGHO2_02_FULL_35_13]